MNSVSALAVDRQGYVWAATQDGVAYYNGRVWRAVKLPDGVQSNWVLSLWPASSGALWLGVRGGGVLRLQDRRWTHIDTSSGLPSDEVWTVLETEDDDGSPVLWVGTMAGLARRSRGSWIVFDTSSGLPDHRVYCLHEARGESGSRTLWVGTRNGLARFARGEWTAFDTSSGLADNHIRCVLETGDGSGALWVGTYGGGLTRFENGRWTVFDAEGGYLPNNRVMCLHETKEGDGARALWVGTYGGGLTRRTSDGEWKPFGTASGLPDDKVNCLATVDDDGPARALWIGTHDGGVARLERYQWIALDGSSGLPSTGIRHLREISENGDPSLWIGTHGGGLAKLVRGRWSVVDSSSGLPDDNVYCVEKIDDGSETRGVWFGTENGLARLDGGAWTVYDRSSGLPDNTVWCVLAPLDGRVLWVGTFNGLMRFEGGEWTAVEKELVPSGLVMCLLEVTTRAKPSEIWVGTFGGGVARRRSKAGADAWTVFDASTGFPNDQVSGLNVVTRTDGRREIWAGTQDGGAVYRALDEPNAPWKVLSDATTPALPNNCVYRIEQDRQGRIYLLTNKGVARLTPRTPTRDDPAEFTVYTFTVDNGLPSNEGNSGASTVDSLGRIWVGTPLGAAVFDPERVEDRTPKALLVEQVLVNSVRRETSRPLVLRHDENDLEFEYALLAYFREADTRYRSQLVGYDRSLTDWAGDWRRVYTNLPAGEYRFVVWGRDSEGNVSGPVRQELRIRPAPWRTWWAYAAYAATTIAAGSAGIHYRTRALERRSEELQAVVEQRTSALADTVEELKASERRALDAKDVAIQAREEALEARTEALEASQAKSVFLANMSHELRTPLNAILGFSQVLERDSSLTADQLESLQIIQRSGEHLLGLINDVLSISKIEAGKLVLAEKPFSLPHLLQSVEAMTKVRAEAKGLDVDFEIDPELPQVVTGDDGKLRQVLINLLGNAVKFTDAGRVALRVASSGNLVAFEVADTGQGIAENEIGNLFHAFTQTESGRSSNEGTGLGLAISQQIVRLMGGEIRVVSRLGTGTTFSFAVDMPASNEALAGASQRRVIGLAPGQVPPRILIVDDGDENRLLLSRLLTVVGFEVHQARDGAHAIEEWRRWRPDLIFMDMRMPVMDGKEATRRIRAAETMNARQLAGGTMKEEGRVEDDSSVHRSSFIVHRSCKIIALTASALDHERADILASGADDFVAKPFRIDTLYAKIAEFLDVSYAYDEAPKPASAVDDEADEGPLTRERLAAVTPGEVQALHELLSVGDFEGASNVAESIMRQDDRLGRAILGEIRAFQFDRLLQLLESL